MDLTIKNFFTHLIFYPKDVKEEDYYKYLCISAGLGIFTGGLLHCAVGIGWMAKRTYVWVTGELSGKDEKINRVKNEKLSVNLSSSKDADKPKNANRPKNANKPKNANNPPDTIGKTDVSIINSSLRVVPTGPINWKKNFLHVDILNQRGYRLNGKIVKLREPMIPKKIERNLTVSFETEVSSLKAQWVGFVEKTPKVHIKDATTDQAINDGEQHKIALNFANEHHAGGGPGIYKDPASNQIIWEGTASAQAQEEALVNKTDLYSSLTLLPTTPEKRDGDTMVRNYYENGGFDSKTTVYTSDNQLFGIQAGDFYTTQFLEIPRDVSFVTSAAHHYGSHINVDVDENSMVYKDATERIRTHLYAAAKKAVEMKKQDASKQVELILGAFGCGAFAPSNAEEYAKMIAEIYQKELSQFNGFFDEITFAIPKMGRIDPEDSFVRNYNAFNSVITCDDT